MQEITGASLQDITAFVAVAQTGSFTLAAERLGTNKSSVGKAIQRLEKHLATLLFQRTTRAPYTSPRMARSTWLPRAPRSSTCATQNRRWRSIAQSRWDACASTCLPALDAWCCPPSARCVRVIRR